MSNKNQRTRLTQKQSKPLTTNEWDFKLAQLTINNFSKFFNAPTFITPEMSRFTFNRIRRDASTAMRMNYGPRPEEPK